MKDSEDAVVAHLDASEVLQPGVGALDFPALAVATKFAFVLESAVANVLSVGDNQLRPRLFESSSQGIGVVASICNN
ncbi:MAG: hypothetical protein WBP63_04640, partial [Silvibacterium sp.]